jgi:hypothetical protein
MRLSGPVRLGIVIYAVWLVAVALFGYGPISIALESNASEMAQFRSCQEASKGQHGFTYCPDPGIKPVPIAPYVIAALAPPGLLFLGWLAFGWVRRGFRAGKAN